MKSKKGGTAGNVFARPLHENAGMDKDFFYSAKFSAKIDDIDKYIMYIQILRVHK